MSVIVEDHRTSSPPLIAPCAPSTLVHPSLLRRLAHTLVFSLCLLLLLQAFFFETFYIPTGSMAPALRGEHRVCECPACGNRVVVGKHPSEPPQRFAPGPYRKAFCPWCGNGSLRLADSPLERGNLVLVNKLAFLTQPPRRWDLAVFFLWGEYLIKRILGLPGEEILLHEGDLYVNNVLVRKTWDEMQALRVPLFDQTLPGPDGWSFRWHDASPSACISDPLVNPVLRLDGIAVPAKLAYRNFSPFEGKCSPLTDEQAYNGSLHPTWETVHDFLVETTVHIEKGEGEFSLALFDGAEEVAIHLPIGKPGTIRVVCRSKWANEPARDKVLLEREAVPLEKSFHVQMAFVDRRVLVRIDGREILPPIDLPTAPRRRGVENPLCLSATGLVAQCRNLKLFRDVHYTQAGTNAVKGEPVRLGSGEYFVLGDNSGRSDDSRHWPDRGAVPESTLIGRAMLRLGAAD